MAKISAIIDKSKGETEETEKKKGGKNTKQEEKIKHDEKSKVRGKKMKSQMEKKQREEKEEEQEDNMNKTKQRKDKRKKKALENESVEQTTEEESEEHKCDGEEGTESEKQRKKGKGAHQKRKIGRKGDSLADQLGTDYKTKKRKMACHQIRKPKDENTCALCSCLKPYEASDVDNWLKCIFCGQWFCSDKCIEQEQSCI